jgi:hypothetical protein
MTSILQVKKEIEKIKKVANPTRTCLGWPEPGDGLVHTSQKMNGEDKTYTVEQFEALKKAEGYAKIILVTHDWEVHK